ncbi:MAG TPA: hypothetical protein VHE59_15480 [Mucilaginibacter sp.]|nr:hypothetical protein [Mucilaginibacter sp.]
MKTSAYLLAALALINFSSCKKSGTSPSKQKGGAMYPATVTSVSTGGLPITWTFTYDSNNNLTKYGGEGSYIVTIDPHNVVQSSFSETIDVVNTYAYSGGSNTPVDIYTTVPAQLSISTTQKNLTTGTSVSYPGFLWAMTAGKDNTITEMTTSDNGGQTVTFSYDANDNLKTVSWINLSGDQAGKVYAALTVTSLDNHPSPFSSVKGYNVIAYTQFMYPAEFALAYCRNNPIQMIYKQLDGNGNLATSEQDDFTYAYNAQGYPTNITVKVSYPNNSTVNSKSSDFTYK